MFWNLAVAHGNKPKAKGMHASTCIGSKIVVFGGFDGRTEFDETHIFDTESLYWSNTPTTGDVPGARRSPTLLAFQDKVYAFGGGQGQSYFNDLYVLDMFFMTWTKVAPTGLVPEGRRGHTAVLWGKTMVVFGGGNAKGQALNDVHLLELEMMQWRSLRTSGDVPEPRGHHTAIMLNETLMAIYGGTDTKQVFGDVSILDLATGTWTKRKIFTPRNINGGVPPARFAHAAVLTGKLMLVVGGHDGKAVTSELLALNLNSMDWDTPPLIPCKIPVPRQYHTVVIANSRVFIVGGITTEGAVNDVWILEMGALAYHLVGL